MKVGVLTITMLAAAAGGAFAQSPAPRMPLETTTQLWFDGSSTVRGFKCVAKTITSSVVTDAVDASAAAIDELVAKATVVIAVAGIDCGNGTMNDHMRKALKASENADVKFVLNSYDVNGGSIVLNGTLTLAGKDNPVKIPATATPEAGGLRVKGSTPIDMTQWGVKPPSLMMGTMKVKPTVNIGFDVLVKR
jgi:polyisoprenoid-binding protein YceI